MQFASDQFRSRIQDLARQGVFIGTSSWKYPGWCGMLYESARYEWRGKFAETRFQRNCLQEYAQSFKTVCVDAAYYAFPSAKSLEELAAQVPDGFLFALKVTDEITVKQYPRHSRLGERAGQPNASFLNAQLFAGSFLTPCEAIRPHIGLLIFEFSRFHSRDFAHGRDFIAALDQFLSAVPSGWPYGVELRNRVWLRQEYFDCLSRHGVTHVFNSWDAMPPVGEQLTLPGSRTNPELVAARFLLKPGRKYEQAVRAFAPYDSVKEVVPEARTAGRALIEEGQQSGPKRRTFVYVNNRLEGNALQTIAAMLEPED